MSHVPETPAPGDHRDEEYSMPCAEALLAGTLALMTGHAQACCDSHREAMGRKIASNLQLLADAEGFTAHFRTVVWSLQARWQQQSQARYDTVGAAANAASAALLAAEQRRALWHPVPEAMQ